MTKGTTRTPLPVSGYTEQAQSSIDMVNENKILEEQVLRALDKLQMNSGVDPRCLSIARTNIEQGFMWMNRAIFKPQRIKLTDIE